jgi:glycosyltransferase involved in cell wall biosynthesis
LTRLHALAWSKPVSAVPPLVSVILPTFDRWPMIGEAVESVLSQNFNGFELIVVDDGSTDETVSGLARFGPRLAIVSTERKGVSSARNTGVSRSRGRYIAFLDSDDLWLPDKLARQTAFMDVHPDVQICQTEEIWIRHGVRVNPKTVHRKPSGDIFLRSLDLCLVSPSAVMMTRSLFDRIGGFDESFPVCEDYDLWLRLAIEQRIPLIAEALVIKRGGHADQLSHSTWGMDRYRVQALQKLLRNGIDVSRRAAVVEVLRRKIGILAAGARKRDKFAEAKSYEAVLDEFDLERSDGRERDSRIREQQGLPPADA